MKWKLIQRCVKWCRKKDQKSNPASMLYYVLLSIDPDNDSPQTEKQAEEPLGDLITTRVDSLQQDMEKRMDELIKTNRNQIKALEQLKSDNEGLKLMIQKMAAKMDGRPVSHSK